MSCCLAAVEGRKQDGCCQWVSCELHGLSCFSFLYKSQTLTLNHQISNGASLSELNTCILNGGWLLMADYWSYICRFRFSIFNYGWELIFCCAIILKVTIYTYFRAHGPGRMEWLIGGTLKLVWWRERARQRRDAETEDEWEARLRQWRERDIEASCFGLKLTEHFHTVQRLAYVFTHMHILTH